MLSTNFDRGVCVLITSFILYQLTGTLKRTEWNLFVYALVTEITHNKRLRSRYRTVEANCRQTQSRGLSATAEFLVFGDRLPYL